MMTESAETSGTTTDLVKKQIFVKASPQRAFDVFTKEMDTWWPLATHHISKVDAKNAVLENGGTRVDLEHRLLRSYGTRADEMHGQLDSEGGWAGLLTRFADTLSAA